MRKFRATLNFQIAFGADGGRSEATSELILLQDQIESLIINAKAHIETVGSNLIDVGPMPLPSCPTCELSKQVKVNPDAKA